MTSSYLITLSSPEPKLVVVSLWRVSHSGLFVSLKALKGLPSPPKQLFITLFSCMFHYNHQNLMKVSNIKDTLRK